MATQRNPTFISPEEYLAIERTSDTRSEYISGEMFAMAAPSKAHGEIIANASRQLGNLLDDAPCRASVGVSVAAPGAFLIPDIVVYCDGGKFTDVDNVLLNPVVIIEVLSPSTGDFDHGHKWIRYQQIPSLMHYVLIAQDEVRVEVFTRDHDAWRYVSYTKLTDEIDLFHINCRVSMSLVYRDITFAESGANTGTK